MRARICKMARNRHLLTAQDLGLQAEEEEPLDGMQDVHLAGPLRDG